MTPRRTPAQGCAIIDDARGCDRLDRMDDALAALAKSANQSEALLSQYLGPQLDHWRAATADIAQQVPQVLASVEALAITLRNLDDRLRSLEVSLSVSIGKLAANADAVAARVTVLEHGQAAQALKIIELEKREHGRDELARTDRRKSTAAAGLISTVAGVAAWLAQTLFK